MFSLRVFLLPAQIALCAVAVLAAAAPAPALAQRSAQRCCQSSADWSPPCAARAGARSLRGERLPRNAAPESAFPAISISTCPPTISTRTDAG